MGITTFTGRLLFFTAGGMLLVLAMEALLWLLPVNTRVQVMSTDRDFPVARAVPHQPYLYSYGWDFLNVVSAQTNNVGMFNSPDYERGIPAIGVIGDSYIEARMLPHGQTLQGNLDKWAAPAGYHTYAASAGGAGLADYLALAKIMRRELDLRSLVILINEGDVLDVLAPPQAGFMGLQCEGGKVSVRHLDYSRPDSGPLRRLAGKSALLRYLDFNLKVKPWLATALGGPAASTGGVSAHALDRACLRDYFRMMGLYAGLPSGRIIFIMDGMRGKLDRKKEPDRYQAALDALSAFRVTAQSLGFGVVDMQPIFDHAYHRQGRRVDFRPRDNHWNGLGHQLAAQELVSLLKAQGGVLGRSTPGHDE